MPELLHISGLSDLKDALEKLPKNIGKNVLRGAVNAGAKVIRDQAKQNAPKLEGSLAEKLWSKDPSSHPPPGTLKKAIYAIPSKSKSNPVKQTFIIGVRQGKTAKKTKAGNIDAYYASWIENGHYYVPKKPKSAAWKEHRAKHTGKGAKWVPAKPFLRPAVDQKSRAAIDAIEAYLQKRIPEEAEKLRRK